MHADLYMCTYFGTIVTKRMSTHVVKCDSWKPTNLFLFLTALDSAASDNRKDILQSSGESYKNATNDIKDTDDDDKDDDSTSTASSSEDNDDYEVDDANVCEHDDGCDHYYEVKDEDGSEGKKDGASGDTCVTEENYDETGSASDRI